MAEDPCHMGRAHHALQRLQSAPGCFSANHSVIDVPGPKSLNVQFHDG